MIFWRGLECGLGAVSEQFWGSFRAILEQFLIHLGVDFRAVSEQFWSSFGAVLGQFWGSFGAV